MAIFMTKLFDDEYEMVTDFELLDTDTMKTIVVSKEKLYSVLSTGKLRVENLRVDGNRLYGYPYKLDRYYTVSSDGYTVKNGSYKLIIGKDTKNNLYCVYDVINGKAKLLDEASLLDENTYRVWAGFGRNREEFHISNASLKEIESNSDFKKYTVKGKFIEIKNEKAEEFDKFKEKAKLVGCDYLNITKINGETVASLNNNTSLSEASDIIIPEGVTAILDHTFKNIKIRQMIIPSTVRFIGECALESARIEELVINIDGNMGTLGGRHVRVGNCYVGTLKISNNSGAIPSNLFRAITVGKIDLSEGIKSLGSSNTIWIKDNDLSNLNLEEIGGGSKLILNGKNTFKFPKNIKRIEEGAILNATTPLDTVELPESLEYLGRRCIDASISKLVINHPIKMEKEAFSDANVTHLVINADLKEIPDRAFNRGSIEKLELNGRIDIIGDKAFRGSRVCKSNGEEYNVKMKYMPKKILGGGFTGLNFGTLLINDKNNNYSEGAFDECNIDRLFIDYTELPYNNILNKCRIGSLVIKTDGIVSKEILGESDVWSIKLMGVIPVIKEDAFRGSMLRQVIIEDGLRKIESRAFMGTKIQKINLPSTIQEIEYCAFGFIDTLKEVIINNDIDINDNILLGSSKAKIIRK